MRLLSCFCAAGLLLGPAPSKEVLAEASERWAADDMEGVVVVFERARATEPHPDYLFGQARAEVRLQRCDDAVEHLEAFLRSEPPVAAVQAAHAELQKCGVDPATVGTQPEPELEPTPPPPVVVQRPPDLGEPLGDHRGEPADALGWSLVGAGGALALAGGTLFGVGASRVARPGSTIDEQAYRERTRANQRLGWSGVAIAAVGGSLLVAGVIRLVRQGRRHTATATARAGKTLLR